MDRIAVLRRFAVALALLFLPASVALPTPAFCADGAADGGGSYVFASGKKDDRPKELDGLLLMKGKKRTEKPKAQTARMKVLENTAGTLGFQYGFAWRYGRIMDGVLAREHEFERIFNFAPLLIDGRVLPPVIRSAEKAVNIESPTSATTVETQYVIVEPARIVSAPPNWRGYIDVEVERMEPAVELVPMDSDESAAWKAKIMEGWTEGCAHADEVFELNMDRLESDYRGILLFRKLADAGLVSVPVLAQGNLGVQVGENVLSIDQRTFRITVPARFVQAGPEGDDAGGTSAVRGKAKGKGTAKCGGHPGKGTKGAPKNGGDAR
jgi:defect-in-organelle-trafficking protein DotC